MDASERRLRVCLQPSWALVPGSRFANLTRAFSTRTQTLDTATSAVGIVGSAFAGALWFLVATIRWINYHLRRRRDWTVTVSSYETRPVKLSGRREPVAGRAVQNLEFSQHTDFASALEAAKKRAAALVRDGYRPLRYPAGWDHQ